MLVHLKESLRIRNDDKQLESITDDCLVGDETTDIKRKTINIYEGERDATCNLSSRGEYPPSTLSQVKEMIKPFDHLVITS